MQSVWFALFGWKHFRVCERAQSFAKFRLSSLIGDVVSFVNRQSCWMQAVNVREKPVASFISLSVSLCWGYFSLVPTLPCDARLIQTPLFLCHGYPLSRIEQSKFASTHWSIRYSSARREGCRVGPLHLHQSQSVGSARFPPSGRSHPALPARRQPAHRTRILRSRHTHGADQRGRRNRDRLLDTHPQLWRDGCDRQFVSSVGWRADATDGTKLSELPRVHHGMNFPPSVRL